MAEPRPGHELQVICERPRTLLVPTITVRTKKQRRHVYEEAARGVNLAIEHEIGAGVLPKDALDDLEIVDVQSKPKGLGADLKADKGFLNDVEGTQSLIQRGFYPVPMPDGKIELLSSDGEVLVRSKEGVEYVLRFGQVAGVEEEGEESSLNRFLFVTARLWDEHFPTPELEKLPEAAGDASPADPTADQGQADDTDQAADKDPPQAGPPLDPSQPPPDVDEQKLRKLEKSAEKAESKAAAAAERAARKAEKRAAKAEEQSRVFSGVFWQSMG